MIDPYCHECQKTTGGCGMHMPRVWENQQTIYPPVVVDDPSKIKIVSDYGPELRRIADALEKLVSLLTEEPSSSNQRGGSDE